jgi:hypothetical protein
MKCFDEIEFERTPPEDKGKRYFAESKGVEGILRFAFDRWTFNGSYAYYHCPIT